jgi:hypothetical protein
MSRTQAALSGDKATRANLMLAGYGVALIAAATLVIVGEPAGMWSAYGLACEALGVGCLVKAGWGPLSRAVTGPRRFSARAASSLRAARQAAHVATPARTRGSGPGSTQWRVICSEWTKFASLRSSRIAPAVATACVVGLAPMAAATAGAASDGSGTAPLDPGVVLLVGIRLAPLAVGVLGVLVITAEYASGLIRCTLTVVPTRMPVLWAKLLVVVGVVAAIAVVCTPTAMLVGVAELRAQGWAVDPTDRELWTAGFQATLYMMLLGVIGLALGSLLRSTAAAISALVGIFFALPLLVQLLPQAGARWIGPYLPAEAGEAIWADPHGWHIGSRAAALIVSVAWAGALFAGASYRLLREDV